MRLPRGGVKIALVVTQWLRRAEPRGCGHTPSVTLCALLSCCCVSHTDETYGAAPEASRCVHWGQFAWRGAPGVTLELMSHCCHITVSRSRQSPARGAHGWGLPSQRPHSLSGENTTAARMWKKPGQALGTFWDYTSPADANTCTPELCPSLPAGWDCRGADPRCEHCVSLPHPRAVPSPCLIPSGPSLG